MMCLISTQSPKSFFSMTAGVENTEHFDKIKFYIQRDLMQRTDLCLVAPVPPLPGKVLLPLGLCRSFVCAKV